jgi:LacI family transcriptional regulator
MPKKRSQRTLRGDGSAKPRATMVDVAALAGVSLTTVSRVVNDHPNVTAGLATRVRKAIEQLDYKHDVNASILRRSDRKTATIGLVLADVANPFMSALHRAVEDYVWSRGVLLLTGSSDEDGEREHHLIREFSARRVDGMIIVPSSNDHSYLMSERRHGTAIVFVDRPPRFLNADTVTSEDFEGSRRAVEHLIAHGHRRVAFLGASRSIPTGEQRLGGYLAGLSAHGVPFDPALVRTELRTMEDAESAATQMLAAADPPTALFAGQNYFTIGASKALRARGLQNEVALIGVDDFPLADLLDPAISVLAHDPVALGREAAGILFRRIEGDQSPIVHVTVPTELIARGSGEIPGPAL